MRTDHPVMERTVAVGRVSPRGVRLWMRSPGGGAHRLELWPRTHFRMADLEGVLKQPVGGLNVGAIEVELDGDVARLNFKLFGEDEDTPGEPKLLFESGFE